MTHELLIPCLKGERRVYYYYSKLWIFYSSHEKLNSSDKTHELLTPYLKWDGEFTIIILALNLLLL